MMLCGMDEVGRGALAGPLVLAAVILRDKIEGLKDSKLLTETKRERLFEIIVKNSLLIDIEVVEIEDINSYGIGWANKTGFENLIKRNSAEKFLVDGNLKINGAKSIIDADSFVPEVMAASIVAKVTRDKMMKDLHKEFAVYDWIKNKGYGTKTHIEALKTHGISPHHRTMFVRTAMSVKN